MSAKTNWYKQAVVYQIYPLSFKDSNNDGLGDIPGIISGLDYIKELGADAIWFSPLYPSPWNDYGYDISDYQNIHPAFGTLDDFDRLISECHRRGIRVMMDAVFNHTSDRHEWFRAALSDPSSPYRDYYIFRHGRRDKKGRLHPPTNWVSCFTGSAWERVPGTDDFYLHLFAPGQPDLNWENPRVREEMAGVLKFWVDRGVDGFRFDVFNLWSKEWPLRSDRNPFRFQKGTRFFVDGPRMHEFLAELSGRGLSHCDSYTVGESYIPDKEHAHRYIKEESGELDSIFDFEHLASDNILGLKMIPKPFSLRQFKRGLLEPQLKYHGSGWNTLVLENHDVPRSVSRFGINTKRYRYEAATFLAMITFLGWGTPFIYQGEEIGMTNCDFGDISELKDPVSRFVYDLMRRLRIPKKAAFAMLRTGARDNARTPMQWDSSANGGFNAGTPAWQAVNDNYKEINAASDIAAAGSVSSGPSAAGFDPGRSIYRFYQKLLWMRKSDEVLVYGDTTEYYPNSSSIICYSRSMNGRRRLIAGNFSEKRRSFILPFDFDPAELELTLSNRGRLAVFREMTLEPYEAILITEKRQCR